MKKIFVFLLAVFGFVGSATAHQGHEHMSNVPTNVQWGMQGLQGMINVHPIFVHFPIALLLTAIAFYILGILFRKEVLLMVGKWTLFAGSLSTVPAVFTGLQAANTVPHGGGIHQTLMAHQYLGFTILTISIALSVWVLVSKTNVPQKGKKVFLIALLLLAAIIGQQADFGGRLVFLNGVGVGKKNMGERQAPSEE